MLMLFAAAGHDTGVGFHELTPLKDHCCLGRVGCYLPVSVQPFQLHHIAA